jgi:hypothetical protein
MTSPLLDKLLTLLKANAELKRELGIFYWSQDIIQPFYNQCKDIIESGNEEEIQQLQDMATTLSKENEKLGERLSSLYIYDCHK